MNDKLLRVFIEASGFDIKETQKVFIKGVLYKGDSSLIPVDNIDDVEVINDYKVTKKPFDILSDDYTDEVVRLHKTIKETNTYNEELYKESIRLKRVVSGLLEDANKLTKKKSIFMGNWKGTDISVTTEQEGELREMMLFTGKDKLK